MPPGPELARLLEGLRPAELILRDWVRRWLDASIVLDMAHAEYGMQVDEHRRGIEALLWADRLPEELPWTPREVLALSSHRRPDADCRPGSADWRDQVARLFSCLVLVRAEDVLMPGPLAGLIESALLLGPDATEDAVRYLAWCRLHEPGSWRNDVDTLPFLTLGLLLLYVMAPGRGDAAIVAGLTRAVVDEVRAALARDQQTWPDQTPSESLKQMAFDANWPIWQVLVGRCLFDSTAGDAGPRRHPPRRRRRRKPQHEAGDRLASLGPAIDGETTASLETLRTWFRMD